jgi:hypothetical protein
MVNQYMQSFGTDAEKQLYTDIATEYLQFAGVDVVYTRRDDFYNDNLLGRSDGVYEKSIIIEMIIEDSEGVGAFLNNIYSKFGLTSATNATISFSADRFREEFNDPSAVPMPGDIVFLYHKSGNPKLDVVMEIRKVDTLAQMQFGGYFEMYTIECFHWTMKDDAIDTGYDVPDSHANDWQTQQDQVSNESDIIKELMLGIKNVPVEEQKDGILSTDHDNPFFKTF